MTDEFVSYILWPHSPLIHRAAAARTARACVIRSPHRLRAWKPVTPTPERPNTCPGWVPLLARWQVRRRVHRERRPVWRGLRLHARTVNVWAMRSSPSRALGRRELPRRSLHADEDDAVDRARCSIAAGSMTTDIRQQTRYQALHDALFGATGAVTIAQARRLLRRGVFAGDQTPCIDGPHRHAVRHGLLRAARAQQRDRARAR